VFKVVIPVKYRDLSRNAQLVSGFCHIVLPNFVLPPGKSTSLIQTCCHFCCCSALPIKAITVWSVTDRPIGGATISFFNQNGKLRSGLQKLALWEGVEADGSIDSNTPGEIDIDADECFRLQKIKERFDRG
jgi:hypothetical protein